MEKLRYRGPTNLIKAHSYYAVKMECDSGLSDPKNLSASILQCFHFAHYSLSNFTLVAWFQMPTCFGNNHKMKKNPTHVFNNYNALKITIKQCLLTLSPSDISCSNHIVLYISHVSESTPPFLGIQLSPHHVSLLSNRS